MAEKSGVKAFIFCGLNVFEFIAIKLIYAEPKVNWLKAQKN